MPGRRARPSQHTRRMNIREGFHHLLSPAQSSQSEQNITPMEASNGKQAQHQGQLSYSPRSHRDNLLPLTSSVIPPNNTMIRHPPPLPPAAVNYPRCPPPSSFHVVRCLITSHGPHPPSCCVVHHLLVPHQLPLPSCPVVRRPPAPCRLPPPFLVLSATRPPPHGRMTSSIATI